MLRFALVSAATLAFLTTIPAGATPSITALPDCQSKLVSRPSQVIFACGDGGVYATNVRWTNWGAPFAVATATMHANDCTPNCAQGHFHVYGAYLAATGRQRCARGVSAYQRVAYVPRTKGLPTARSRLDWLNLICR